MAVERALRRSGDREDRAINMLLEVCVHVHTHSFTRTANVLLQGLIADAADDAPPSEPHDRFLCASRHICDALSLAFYILCVLFSFDLNTH